MAPARADRGLDCCRGRWVGEIGRKAVDVDSMGLAKLSGERAQAILASRYEQ